MTNEPSKAVIGAWIRLMRAQQAILLKIERALREAGLPPLSWYDVLWDCLLYTSDAACHRPGDARRRSLCADAFGFAGLGPLHARFFNPLNRLRLP